MGKSSKKNGGYINPYLGGVLLGLVLLAANFVSGRGLGASGAIKGTVVAGVKAVAPDHYDNATFYQEYAAKKERGGKSDSWPVPKRPRRGFQR